MNRLHVARLVVSAFTASSVFTSLPAQTNPVALKEETIVLSPFVVSGENIGRYQSNEAASGARVRVSLFDSTQNVSVVTRELIDDVGTGRILDATKYVAGVSESTIPNAQDRTNIRGFQADGVTLDGFSYFSFANLDPSIIDRIEIVKGPNAILAPQGVPGGTANVVSRRPTFRNKGYVSLQVGEYNSNRAEFDVNRVVSDKLAVRVVGAAQKTDDYAEPNFHRSNIIMPMVTYRFSRDTEITAQLEAYDYKQKNHLGIPIDPYVGTLDKAVTIRGVSKELVPYDDDVFRYQKALHSRIFFTHNFNRGLSLRVAAHHLVSKAVSTQSNLAGANPGRLDPATGNWIANDAAPGASRTYTRSYGYGPQQRRNFDLQTDLVYRIESDAYKSITTGGIWLNQSTVWDQGYAATKAPFNIDNYTAAPGVIGALNNNSQNISRTRQAYIIENLTLFQHRLILNAGVAKASYSIHVSDRFRSLTAENDPSVTTPSYGAVVKPVKGVALFYGFSKQSTAIGPSTTSVIPNKLQTSEQKEYGIRVQLLENKLYATLSRFDIVQNNFSVPNPANLVVPPPVPALPALFMDRLAEGWEFELRASLTDNWSLIGNYTDFTNRTPFGQVFRGIAEKSGAVWTSYSFKKGPLEGLFLGVGLDYLDERGGDAPSGTPTSASTPTNIILPQPTFWLPARTLVSANISYSWNPQWKVQLHIENALDEEYLAAGISRMAVWNGAPRSARLTVRYDF